MTPQDHHTRRRLTVMRIGERFRQTRTDRGMSQEEVAARAEISVHAYGAIERGWTSSGSPTNPTLDTLMRVQTALDLDFPILLETLG